MLRALVAEDTTAYQTIMQSALEYAGYEVQLASNGQEALDILKTDTFHILFIDMNMPVMHGLSALRIIRTMECGPKMHIVVVTANPHMAAGDEVEQLSDFVMQKPLDVVDLAAFAERLKNVPRGITAH